MVLGLALVIGAPYIVWHLQSSRSLNVVIVDKTVPFSNWREHAAIPWILHAMKLRQDDGRFLDPAHDYVGFDPVARKGHELAAADLSKADALFIADTYGVYVGDYERPDDQAALERSPKIHGGVEASEAHAIEAFVARGGTVLAEFNTFASPTSDDVRARLETVFGVRWTKWVGRFWPNLQDPNEVPQWVGRVYEHVTGEKFDLTGAGLVFVRDDQDMVVLRAGTDLGPNVVAQERTAKGATYDFPERGGFWFWMDVLEAGEAEVLYDHVIDVTESGAAKLAAHGLSRRFPALTRRRDAWYFAGDFVDNTLDLGSPERAWLLSYRRRAAGCGGGTTTDEGFFWGFYVPIVSRILGALAR